MLDSSCSVNTAMLHYSKYKLSALLISSWVLGLAGVSFYTPAMPVLLHTIGQNETLVKYTISFFIFGKAAGMFFCGPFADSFNRKQFLLVGLSFFVIGSFCCLSAPNIHYIIGGRALQGIGVSIAILMGRAIVNQYESRIAANVFGYIFTGNAIAITLLPILGGYTATYFGWRGIFAALLLYGLVVIGLILRYMPTTNTISSLRHLKLTILIQNYKTILSNRSFWGFQLCFACTMAGEKAFTTGSAFIFVHMLGLSKVTYGYIMGLLWGAHLIGTFCSGQWVLKYGINRMLKVGVLAIGSATLCMGLVTLFGLANAAIFSILIFLFMLGTGFVVTSAAVGIIRPFPHLVGITTALAMFMEFALAFITSFIVSHLKSTVLGPIMIVICITGIATFLSWWWLLARSAEAKQATHSS